jgi:hypothetical protein
MAVVSVASPSKQRVGAVERLELARLDHAQRGRVRVTVFRGGRCQTLPAPRATGAGLVMKDWIVARWLAAV